MEQTETMDISNEIPIEDGVLTTFNTSLNRVKNDLRTHNSELDTLIQQVETRRNAIITKQHELNSLDRAIKGYVPTGTSWREDIAKLVADVKTVEKAFNLNFHGFSFCTIDGDPLHLYIYLVSPSKLVDGMLIAPHTYRVTWSLTQNKPNNMRVIRWISSKHVSYFHPHVGSSALGNICMGNASNYIAQCTSLMDYVAIHLAPLHVYNVDSPYTYKQNIGLGMIANFYEFHMRLKDNGYEFGKSDAEYFTNYCIGNKLRAVENLTRNTTNYWKYGSLAGKFHDTREIRAMHMFTASETIYMSTLFNNDPYKTITPMNISDVLIYKRATKSQLEAYKNDYPIDFKKYVIAFEIYRNLLDIKDTNFQDIEKVYEFNKGFLLHNTRQNAKYFFDFIKLTSEVPEDVYTKWIEDMYGISSGDLQIYLGTRNKDTAKEKLEDMLAYVKQIVGQNLDYQSPSSDEDDDIDL